MREDLASVREHVDNGFAEIHGRLDGRAAGPSSGSGVRADR